MTVMELVFENGVLKPMSGNGLKEHHRYAAVLRELTPSEKSGFEADPELATELERRTTVLPDGSTVIRLGGLFASLVPHTPDEADDWDQVFEAVRCDRERHFDEEWPVLPEAE